MVVPRLTKDLKLSEKFLYGYGKSLGLVPFTLNEFGILKFSFFGLFYSIILIGSLTWTFVITLDNRIKMFVPGQTAVALIVYCFGDVLRLLTMYAIWILFAFRQERILTIIGSFIEANVIASKVGITEFNSGRFLKKLGTQIMIVNIIYFIYQALTHAQMITVVEFKICLCSIVSNGFSIIYRNVLIIFINLLLMIKERFQSLNETTKNVSKTGRVVRDVTDYRLGCNKYRMNSLAERIQIVGQIHHELTELAESVTDFLSLPLLIILLMYFIQLVTCLYISCVTIFGYHVTIWQEYSYVAMTLTWYVAIVLEFLTFGVICNSICNEAKRTATILHEVSIESTNSLTECNRMINLVSLSLLQNQLKLTIYGFFDLDLTLMYKISGTMTMYMVIMMQLDQEATKKYGGFSMETARF